MKKTGVIVGCALVLLFMMLLMTTTGGIQSEVERCYVPPVDLGGRTKSNATQQIEDSSLFGKFQSAPSFSAADRVEQRKNAATIVSIGSKHEAKFSDRDISVAVGAAFQESNMLNLPYQGDKNDSDSLGLFQQRPSQGYGTASDILDIDKSIDAFYDRLAKVADRDNMSLIEIAIKIQIPNREAYYSRWDWDDLSKEVVATYKSDVPTKENYCASAAGVELSGSAKLPVDSGYSISSGFNDPNYVASKPHKGIDLVFSGGSSGRPVYSALSGVVIESGYGNGCNGSSNNPVTILTDDGIKVGYLHMNGSDILVQKGDTVTSGQRIGSIGNCGQSTGAHLHFEFSPAEGQAGWVSGILTVQKYGQAWLDPAAIMQHYGVALIP